MRRSSAEVDLCRCRPAETLMRTEVGVVDEAHLDLRCEVLCDEWSHQAQSERVLQRPPEAFDQRDGALLTDRSEPLFHPELPEHVAERLALSLIHISEPTRRTPIS